jgi:uncharacterized RDD family membrane protein YckC
MLVLSLLTHQHPAVFRCGLWALTAAYEVTSTALRGRTIGKRALGIRIVGPGGQVPGWRAAGLRWLLPCSLGLLTTTASLLHLRPAVVVATAVSLAVFGRAAFVPDRRGFHDVLAGTRVVVGAA